MNQNRLVVFTKYLLNFMFYSSIIVVISLPYTLKLIGKYLFKETAEHYIFMLVILLLSGLCGLTIVYQLKNMMRTVAGKDCFVDSNIKSLKTMGKAAFFIAGIFLVKMFVLPTPAAFIIILTFFIAGIFSHVLGLVFAEAVRCKKENDLTI